MSRPHGSVAVDIVAEFGGMPLTAVRPDTYGHLWPDADESTRSAIGAVIAKRMDSLGTTADGLRTQ
jgi:hypothetical protein